MVEISHLNGFHTGDPVAEVSTDYLIVGTGPAGASLACFLAQHGKTKTALNNNFSKLCTDNDLLGLTGLIVSQDPGNADTPRAHITNMAALGKVNSFLRQLAVLI
jgi:hypothetical protein